MNPAPQLADPLSNAQLLAKDFHNAALRQLSTPGEEGINFYISAGYARWN